MPDCVREADYGAIIVKSGRESRGHRSHEEVGQQGGRRPSTEEKPRVASSPSSGQGGGDKDYDGNQDVGFR